MSNLAQPIIIPAAAVDVGHFSTKFTLGRATNNGEIKVSQFPSEAVPLPGGLDDLPMSRKPSGFLVTVKGAPYFIGQDVDTLGGAHGARSVADDFVRTPAYYALFLGALGYIARAYGATSRLIIKNLVVGLPMTTFSSLNGELHTLVQGVHNVPVNNGEQVCKVEISQVTVLPQPMGTLFNAGLGKTQQEQNSTSLVLDMGGGTFDWYVSKGMQPMPQRCGAVNVGMLTCCAELCDRIKPNLRNNREIMSRVDHALRSNALTVRVTGEEIDLEKYQPQVADVLNRAFGPMLKKVGDLDDVDFILLTGGGANLLAKMAAAKLQQYTKLIRLDEEPVFSNVRGFHLAAEHLIATAQ